MKALRWLLLTTMWLPTLGQAQLFVGNGGEGWLIDDQLLVRDLVESGTHLEPYFGEFSSSLPASAIENSGLASLKGVPTGLLLRKLSDAQKFYPFFGDVLLEALSSFSWSMTEQPLRVLPDDAPIIDIDPSQRVQIANRFQGRILIHKQSWMQLNEAHRAALLIHEAVFSLLPPSCKEGVCQQESHFAREVVGLLFMNPNNAPSRDWIHQRLQLIFGWNWKEQAVYPAITLSLISLEGEVSHEYSLIKAKTKDTRYLFIKEFCQLLDTELAENKKVILSLWRRPFVLHSRSYSPGEDEPDQRWLQALPMQSHRQSSLTFSNSAACRVSIEFEAEKWLVPRI